MSFWALGLSIGRLSGRSFVYGGGGVSEDDLEKIREAGEKMGRLLATVETLTKRVGRLELGILGMIGAIIAAWAKSKGLL